MIYKNSIIQLWINIRLNINEIYVFGMGKFVEIGDVIRYSTL